MQFNIRRFDIYRKIPKDLTQPTTTGACISISMMLFIAFLMISELKFYLSPEITSTMFVADPVWYHERIQVKLDISLPRLKCEYLGLDIQDDLGRHDVGFVENVDKIPAYSNDGCRLRARFQVNKVPGNFHISTHAAAQQPDNPDMAHILHEVTFGERPPYEKRLPGSFNPLANRDKTNVEALNSHDYFIKVVPTVFEQAGQRVMNPYQYTFAYRDYQQFGHGHRVMPAIWFRYDLSPITVKYSEKKEPFYSFLTKVCAIIGGTFTVASIIDSLVFTASEVFKKAELNKLS